MSMTASRWRETMTQSRPASMANPVGPGLPRQPMESDDDVAFQTLPAICRLTPYSSQVRSQGRGELGHLMNIGADYAHVPWPYPDGSGPGV